MRNITGHTRHGRQCGNRERETLTEPAGGSYKKRTRHHPHLLQRALFDGEIEAAVFVRAFGSTDVDVLNGECICAHMKSGLGYRPAV